MPISEPIYMQWDLEDDGVGSRAAEGFTMATAIGVAARIWCDPDYSHVVMDTGVAFRIAKMLYALANREDR